MSKVEQRSLLGRWRSLQPFLGVSSLALGVLVGAAVLAGLAEAMVLALVVQAATVLQTGEEGAIDLGPLELNGVAVPTLIWMAFGFGVLRLGLQYVNAFLPARIGADVQARLRTRLFDAFSRASWRVQAEEREGHLQEILTTQVSRATALVSAVATGVGAFFNFGALVFSAFLLDAFTAGLVVLAAALMFLALRPLARWTRKETRELVGANLAFAHGVTEAVRVSEEAQVFGVARNQRARLGRLSHEVRRPYFRSQAINRSVAPTYQGVTILLLVGALAGLYITDATGVAALGAVVLILIRAMTYSQTAQSTYHSIQEALPFVETVETSLDRYDRAAIDEGSSPLGSIDSLELRDVSFSYVPGRPVLRDVCFRVDKGETVGIVGPSGAGKSTLVQLLLRLRQPCSGVLLVDGDPAPAFLRADWSRRISYVPQDSRLIDATVGENIRFHRPWVTDDNITAAARTAHIHQDIESWSAGYDTMIGQRADAVSGGQRQRLCLARALAGDPDVLVLDEPTSALDLASEDLVQRSLQKLRGRVTLLIVAHRLSTLRICDRLLVFEGGRLTASGSHGRLMETDGFYRDAVVLSRDDQKAPVT